MKLKMLSLEDGAGYRVDFCKEFMVVKGPGDLFEITGWFEHSADLFRLRRFVMKLEEFNTLKSLTDGVFSFIVLKEGEPYLAPFIMREFHMNPRNNEFLLAGQLYD